MSDSHLLAVYQVLAARASGNRTFMWQVPALTLTTQAVLIGLSAQIQAQASVRIILACTIAFIGAASLALQFKVGMYTLLDMRMLDKFEAAILGDKYKEYGLHHGKTLKDREREFESQLRADESALYDIWLPEFLRPARLLPLTMMWATLQTAVSIVGASVPILPLL